VDELIPVATPKHATKLAMGQYHPKEKNTTALQIELVQLVSGLVQENRAHSEYEQEQGLCDTNAD
jgi:hypothetical protein